MTYLLDTNTCIRYLNRSSEAVVRQITTRSPDEVCICNNDRLVISIKNIGNGPAKIKKITFNKLTKNGITPTNLAELLPAKLLPKEEDYAEVFCTQLDGESYLEAGGEMNLLTVQKSANNKKANSEEFGQCLEEIRSELSSVEIVIDYADMFNEAMSRKGSLRPFKTKRLRG